jgi:hypothetical protein
MATDEQVAEAKRVRKLIFGDTILGIGENEQYVIIGRIMGVRSGVHTVEAVRELVEGLMAGLPQTGLDREMVDGVMGRIRSYLEAGTDE